MLLPPAPSSTGCTTPIAFATHLTLRLEPRKFRLAFRFQMTQLTTSVPCAITSRQYLRRWRKRGGSHSGSLRMRSFFSLQLRLNRNHKAPHLTKKLIATEIGAPAIWSAILVHLPHAP